MPHPRTTFFTMAAVALVMFGAGLIAYTGLVGVDDSWRGGGLPFEFTAMPGPSGYLFGAACVLGGLIALVLSERKIR